MEVFSELQTALDLEYFTEDSLNQLRPKFILIGKMLSGLRNAYAANLTTTNPKP